MGGCFIGLHANPHSDRPVSRAITVGSEPLVRGIQGRLDSRARHHQIDRFPDRFVLHETHASYNTTFAIETGALSDDNIIP